MPSPPSRGVVRRYGRRPDPIRAWTPQRRPTAPATHRDEPPAKPAFAVARLRGCRRLVFLRRNLHRRPRVMAFLRRSPGAPGLVVIDFTPSTTACARILPIPRDQGPGAPMATGSIVPVWEAGSWGPTSCGTGSSASPRAAVGPCGVPDPAGPRSRVPVAELLCCGGGAPPYGRPRDNLCERGGPWSRGSKPS
jgi:hypothetical protein